MPILNANLAIIMTRCGSDWARGTCDFVLHNQVRAIGWSQSLAAPVEPVWTEREKQMLTVCVTQAAARARPELDTHIETHESQETQETQECKVLKLQVTQQRAQIAAAEVFFSPLDNPSFCLCVDTRWLVVQRAAVVHTSAPMPCAAS